MNRKIGVREIISVTSGIMFGAFCLASIHDMALWKSVLVAILAPVAAVLIILLFDLTADLFDN